MSNTTIIYAATIVVIAAVAVGAHYLVALDWPWAIVAGAVASVAARALAASRHSGANLR